jgi:hypothetical protein
MIGMLDAQITAMKQEEAGRKAYQDSLGKAVDASEIKERFKSPAELFFEEFKKRGDTAELARLQSAGFTDAEIAQYISTQRMSRMASAATRQNPEEDIGSVLARMSASAAGAATGFGAVGDVAMSAARVQNLTVPTPTPAMLARTRASAMGTGGSVASLLLGAEDPRAALSSAAQRENFNDIFGSAVPTRASILEMLQAEREIPEAERIRIDAMELQQELDAIGAARGGGGAARGSGAKYRFTAAERAALGLGARGPVPKNFSPKKKE